MNFELIKKIVSLLESHSSLLTVLIIVIGGFWAFIKFREYLKDKRFRTYHELIDWLVNEQKEPDRSIKLDRQIAVVYELRNYPFYFDVSKRILNGLLYDTWKDADHRIKEEIQLTLQFMNKSWLKRKLKI